MKKFISTLTSLAMGASLTAGALAVPFSASAADTKKSLTIVPEKTTVSAAEIAAGDVKIKCQVFFDDVDGNNDTASIQAMMTFGDCASDNIKMTGLTNMFTVSTEYNSIVCDSGFFYVGTVSSRTKKFAPDGDYTGEVVNDKRCAFSWTRPSFDGKYLGEKASDVPVGEFEVTLSKGAAAGNYSIEFLNEDMTFVNPSYVGKDNATTAVSNKDYTTFDNKYFGGLETNGAVIKVEGGSSSQETTTPKATTTTPKQETTTTPKQGTPVSTDKLQWTISETKMDKGATDTVWVDVIVSNAWGSDAATEGLRGVAAGFKYDTANFTLAEVDTESCYGTLSSNKAAGLVSITPASSEDTGIIAKEGDGICYLGFTPKSANVAEGTYAITWDKNETKGILDPGSFGGVNDRPVKYVELDLVDGAIIVGNGGTPGTTTPVVTPAQETTTTKTNPGTQTDKLQWSIKDAEMFVGDTDTVWVDVIVSNAWGSDAATEGLRGVAAGFKYDTANFTLAEVDTESCYGTLSSNKAAGLVSITPASSEDTGIIAKEGDGICYLGFTPKANVAAGTYAITWDKNETKGILDPGSFGGVNDRPVKYAELDLVDGAIVVKEKTTTPEETTTTTTTTTTPKQETTTTTTTPAPTQPTQPTETTPAPTQPTDPTKVAYGDTNCDGTVNIADVVMLNKYLTNAEKYPITDQGKKNADCDTKAGLTTNDSYCIIRSIVKLVTLPCAD